MWLLCCLFLCELLEKVDDGICIGYQFQMNLAADSVKLCRIKVDNRSYIPGYQDMDRGYGPKDD